MPASASARKDSDAHATSGKPRTRFTQFFKPEASLVNPRIARRVKLSREIRDPPVEALCLELTAAERLTARERALREDRRLRSGAPSAGRTPAPRLAAHRSGRFAVAARARVGPHLPFAACR